MCNKSNGLISNFITGSLYKIIIIKFFFLFLINLILVLILVVLILTKYKTFRRLGYTVLLPLLVYLIFFHTTTIFTDDEDIYLIDY